MIASMRRAAVYVRISRDRAGAGLGVARQEKDCRSLAKRLGWNVTVVHVDNDVSAYRARHRPGYEQLLTDLRAGRVDGLLVWHTDRLHRSPIELERFIDVVENASIAIETVQAGPLDLASPAGRMIARQLGAVARYESEHRSERLKSKAAELAIAGQVSGGGLRPYGFETDQVTHNPAEVRVLRELVHHALLGESLNALCRRATAMGSTTSTGREWSPGVLKRVLISARIAGLRVHRGDVVGKAAWDPIIDEATHAQLVAQLTARNHPRASRTYLLTGGLARCGQCGKPLIAAHNHGKRSLACGLKWRPGTGGSCGATSCIAAPVEELVATRVLARLSTPAARRKLAAGKASVAGAHAADRLTDLESRLTQLGRDYADDLIGRTEFLAARDRLNEHAAAARSDLSARRVPDLPSGSPDDLATWWSGASLAERRAILDLFVHSVEIGPGATGGAFRPERVSIVWR
jgi:DNA invertase Pin-like site-specific DNA recombinase